jgi:4'-phosphopantetheinyl transferase
VLWQSPKIFPTLSANQVHIWRASLIREGKELLGLKALLNREEQERAAKFMVKGAANSFIIARGLLRKLLSKYLQIFPQDLVFQQNQYGKLYLNSLPLQFNLSHSHDLALFIFTVNSSVGVDVEFIRKDYEFFDIARKFFSKTENKELFSLPKKEHIQAFFNCWTCKEAFIKAKGVGMFRGLDEFSVDISSNKWGKVMLKEFTDAPESKNWALEAIDPGDAYSGAFAIGSSDYHVDFYNI